MDYKERLKKARDQMSATRRANLEALVSRYGSITALAIAVSRSPNQIGDLVRGYKPIGEQLARHIESAVGLEPNHLDKDATGKPVNDGLPKSTEVRAVKVPLLSHVQAGTPWDQGDLCYDEYIEVIGNVDGSCYALRVNGDSMSPLIEDGDIVVVDPNRWPRPGDYVVARSALENINGATVKRYYPIGFDKTGREIFEARPLNTIYPTMHSVEQQLSICGTVCKLLKDL